MLPTGERRLSANRSHMSYLRIVQVARSGAHTVQRTMRVVVVLLAMMVIAAACGGGDDTEDETSGAEADATPTPPLTTLLSEDFEGADPAFETGKDEETEVSVRDGRL